MDYAIIGNCTSAALVGPDASIDWLCLPFFDSPSLFGRILDVDRGGFFRISAENVLKVTQNYAHHTPIVKTRFETKDGIFDVFDYMPRFITSGGEVHCPSEIHRNIHVIAGRPRIKVDFKPCPNYGLAEGHLKFLPDYLKITSREGEYNSYYLYSNLDLEAVARGEAIELKASSFFLLSYHEKLSRVSQEKIYLEYEKTKSYWMDWVFRTRVPEKYKEVVIRSVITLKLLMFQRTGAVIAAPTTSLPEIIGGDRNWDYRFCWVRDASMIIDLYARMGHVHSAERFIQFILGRMLVKNENIAVMYGINGERVMDERTLKHLAGYQGSKPVRIGNAAYQQKQNDVYGELIEALYSYFITNPNHQKDFDEELWTVVRSLANKVALTWREPDCGIWERRGPPRHFVHSKLMNWVAMDRAAKISRFVGKERHVPMYLAVAEEIKQDILTHGWNPELNSFAMHYESKDLDASNLMMLHYGFLPSTDHRIMGTVEAALKHLVRNGFVMRYTADDELGTPKNAFIVCTFWLINAMHLTGRKEEARAMFDQMISRVNRVGLLSEDIEPETGHLTGNFPQGYSHLALIQTAFLLETNYQWNNGAQFLPPEDGRVHKKELFL
ncbi:MAG: glycoside hydrolase family 15 protein [Candidatus Omnitrophica bacterium]|nr:glycoside hydrolase family 15 protein [Candidatus Omnitrophota bacterium]